MAEPPEDFASLPSAFTATVDPVEENPFPVTNPRHARWAEVTRIAEAKVFEINSHHLALPISTDEVEVAARMMALIVFKFDVWAERGMNVVWSDPEIRLFDQWLVNYANNWLALARDHPPPIVALDAFLGPLRMKLGSRVEHWKAEARQYVAAYMTTTQKVYGDGVPLKATYSTAAGEAETGRPLESDELKQRRSALLREYKSATGNPANRQIYTVRNSGIHKPQFYEWLNGILPAGSETAKNFERFLRDKKAPIPRRPK